MSGAFSTAKPACSTVALVQRVDRADAVQHVPPDLQAVVDLRGLRQVEQRARQHRVAAVEIDAADQVGGVLLLREPLRRRAGRAAARTARTPTSRAPVGTRNASAWIETKQVGLHAPRLLHARRRAARSSRRRASASRACRARRRCSRLQLARDRQHDVLLERAAAPDRAGILAAVAGVERDGDPCAGPAASRAGLRFGAGSRAAPRRASGRGAASLAPAPRAAPSADRAASADRGRARAGARTRRPASARTAAVRRLGLAGRTPRAASPAPCVPKRIAAMYGSVGCTRVGSCAQLGRELAPPSRSSTTRCGSLSVDQLVRERDRRFEDERACIPAPATGAPTRCARRCAHAADGTTSCAAGSSSHGRRAPALERHARLRASVRGSGCGHRASGIVHRPPCALRARARARHRAASARMRERHREIRRRQQIRRRAPAIRPGRPRRRGSNRRVLPFPIPLDRRTDKNQSDKSISSKTDNVQPACRSGS